jgi:hypothetical protein
MRAQKKRENPWVLPLLHSSMSSLAGNTPARADDSRQKIIGLAS